MKCLKTCDTKPDCEKKKEKEKLHICIQEDEYKFCLDLAKELPAHPAVLAWVSFLPSCRLCCGRMTQAPVLETALVFALPPGNLCARKDPSSLGGSGKVVSLLHLTKSNGDYLPEMFPMTSRHRGDVITERRVLGGVFSSFRLRVIRRNAIIIGFNQGWNRKVWLYNRLNGREMILKSMFHHRFNSKRILC